MTNTPDTAAGRSWLPSFLLAIVLAAIVVAYSASCSQVEKGPSSGELDDAEIGKRLRAASMLDIAKSYTQTFESQAALADFAVCEVSSDVSPTKMILKNGRLEIDVTPLDVVKTADDGTTYTETTRPRSVVWLNKPLPHAFELEFEVEALSMPQDLNFFFAGNGKNLHGSYEVVVGGQNNSKNGVYIWLPEDLYDYDAYRQKVGGSREMLPLRKGERYTMRLERDGLRIKIYVNGTMIMDAKDSEVIDTLAGPRSIAPILEDGNRYIGFSSWEHRIAIDNIRIKELAPNQTFKAGAN